MRYSTLFTRTQKTAKEYDSINATLLQKGGFIHQTMAGVYSFLPLGLRVLNKIEAIIRTEMDTLATEALLPALSPKSLWETTRRLETLDVLFKVMGANPVSVKKNSQEYILNPTHEDIVTPLVAEFNSSYKHFPFAVYQIQTKFRNEPRPKSGLLRAREFRMKDLYSFHTSIEDLHSFYEIAKTAYQRIFEQLGLGNDTYVTRASGGDFTDDFSHEFQTQCSTGEDVVFYNVSTKIAYNREIAPSQIPVDTKSDEALVPMQEVEGVGIIGVEALAKHLRIPVEKTTKTILFERPSGEVIAAAVRGDYDINELKLKKITGFQDLQLASSETVKRVTNAEVGYAGLINLPTDVVLIFDDSLQHRTNFECGANRTNYHSINVNFGRDLPLPDQFYDIKVAKEGDVDPTTGEPYQVFKAAEVGNIFPLHTRFSESFNFTYRDENGMSKHVYMGSYGIGSSRVMGVLVEKFHDDKGIVWPAAVAPFTVHLMSLGNNDEIQKQTDTLYQHLSKAGIDVLYDDRSDVSAGQKLADADLIGIPWRLIISPKTGDKIEVKQRSRQETSLVDKDAVIDQIKQGIHETR